MPTTAVLELDDVPDLVIAGDDPARRRKKRIVIAAAGVLALIAAGGGGAYAWFAMKPAAAAAKSEGVASADAGDKAYVDVPSMIVNLRSSDGRARMLKLHVMLVATDEGKVDAVKAKLPLYLDALQPFLRELRPEDLNGSAAVFRMKEEMMARANDALGAGMVRDILIQDLVQQ